MKASECKCCVCGKQAVAFWPVCDPDIPSHPYCQGCLDKEKKELLKKLIEIDKKVMKAKVPKKIYMSPAGVLYQGEKQQSNDVEYIRTDAIIEKAVKYIANNMRCDGYTLQTKAKFIKEFKNYMKG